MRRPCIAPIFNICSCLYRFDQMIISEISDFNLQQFDALKFHQKLFFCIEHRTLERSMHRTRGTLASSRAVGPAMAPARDSARRSSPGEEPLRSRVPRLAIDEEKLHVQLGEMTNARDHEIGKFSSVQRTKRQRQNCVSVASSCSKTILFGQ